MTWLWSRPQITHIPPELMADGVASKAVDVYALGVLMWELYHGHRAWAGLSQTQVSCSPSVKTSAADPNLILTLP